MGETCGLANFAAGHDKPSTTSGFIACAEPSATLMPRGCRALTDHR